MPQTNPSEGDQHSSQSTEEHQQNQDNSRSSLRRAIEWGARKKRYQSCCFSLSLWLVKPQSVPSWVRELGQCLGQGTPGIFSISEGIKLQFHPVQNKYSRDPASRHRAQREISPVTQPVQQQLPACHLIPTTSHRDAALRGLSNP